VAGHPQNQYSFQKLQLITQSLSVLVGQLGTRAPAQLLQQSHPSAVVLARQVMTVTVALVVVEMTLLAVALVALGLLVKVTTVEIL
jgi:hypothetical protein